MAPNIFGQLHVIRCLLGSSYVTCAYALLAGKTYEEYVGFLQAVVGKSQQLGYQPNPNVVISDFEIAVIRAVKDVLGDHVRHQGCFNHLTQSTCRKVLHLTVFLM